MNQDADRLSHPELAASVIAEASAAGFAVIRLRPTPADWQRVETAVRGPCAA